MLGESGANVIYLQQTGSFTWANESPVTSDSNFVKQFGDKGIKQTPSGSIWK